MNKPVFSKAHISKSKYLTTLIFGRGIEKQDTFRITLKKYNFLQLICCYLFKKCKLGLITGLERLICIIIMSTINNLVFSKGHMSKSKYLTTFIFGQGIEKQDTFRIT